MKRSLGAQTLVYPHPVLIVAAYDADGRPNMMNAAWGGICCSRPPCVAVSLRAATYTHGCIMARRAFTINTPNMHQVELADYVGIASGHREDKFAATGLTAERSAVVDAPCIAEFPLVLECRVLHVNELGLHTQFVGEIVDARCEEAMLGDNGLPDIRKLQPFLYASGNRAYFAIGQELGAAFSMGRRG